jgi:uncharacterized protein YndB with AHSA1/START domain
MQNLRFTRDFDRPTHQVFEFFAEHENLGPILGAKITRLSDGDDGNRNGVGSCRRLKVGPAPAFEETVTAYLPDELIEYRITDGSPLRDHVGVVRFTPTATGTHLEWQISFSAAVPGLDLLIGEVLKRRMSQAIARVGIPV